MQLLARPIHTIVVALSVLLCRGTAAWAQAAVELRHASRAVRLAVC
jgi:hypothetical protein